MPDEAAISVQREGNMTPPPQSNDAITYDDVGSQPFGDGRTDEEERGEERTEEYEETAEEEHVGVDDLEVEFDHQDEHSLFNSRPVRLAITLTLLYALVSFNLCITARWIMPKPQLQPQPLPPLADNLTMIQPPTINVNSSVFNDFATLKFRGGILSYHWQHDIHDESKSIYPSFTALEPSLRLCKELCDTLVTFGTVWDADGIREPLDDTYLSWGLPQEGYLDKEEVDVYSYCSDLIDDVHKVQWQLNLVMRHLPASWIQAAALHLAVLNYRIFLWYYHEEQVRAMSEDKTTTHRGLLFPLAPLAYLHDSLDPDPVPLLRQRLKIKQYDRDLPATELQSLEEALEEKKQGKEVLETASRMLDGIEAGTETILMVANSVVDELKYNPLKAWRVWQLRNLLASTAEPLRHSIGSTASTLRLWLQEEAEVIEQEKRLHEYVGAMLNATTLFGPDEIVSKIGASIGGEWVRNPWLQPWQDPDRPMHRDSEGRIVEELGLVKILMPDAVSVLQSVNNTLARLKVLERVWNSETKAWWEEDHRRGEKKY